MDVKRIKGKAPWLNLAAAIAVLAIGILMIVLPIETIENLLVIGAVATLAIFGTVRMIQSFILKKHLEGILSIAFCYTVSCILLALSQNTGDVVIVPGLVIGIVSVILGLMRLLICVNCIANSYKGSVRNGISAILCLGFGLAVIIRPIKNFGMLSIFCGVYLIFYSFTMLGDFFASILQTDLSEERTHRRTHRVLPNLINAVKPSGMISEINEGLKSGKVTAGVMVEEKESDLCDKVNAEILVHLTTQGANKFGHVDIALGDTVYTYGTYDSTQVKFAGFVSQGSFVIVPKVPYLKYCLNVQKKYVIGFGAAFSDKQYHSIEDKIAEMLSFCKPLLTQYEQALLEGRDGADCTDVASNIVRDLKGKVYTVKRGPFRRYFGINTNCVHAADWLLSESGIDAMAFSSLRTPGAYYSMLQNMFTRKNTRIVRKTTYIKADDIK